MENASQSLLERQRNMGRYMMLGTVIITVVNVVLLLANADLFVPYCGALAYYLVVLGKAFDNNFYTYGTEIGEFTYTGMVMCFAVLAVMLVLWWLGRRSVGWMKACAIALIVDTVVLLAVAILLYGEIMGCLMEILLHCAVIWEIWQGIKAQQQLDEMARQAPMVQQPEEEQIPEVL